MVGAPVCSLVSVEPALVGVPVTSVSVVTTTSGDCEETWGVDGVGIGGVGGIGGIGGVGIPVSFALAVTLMTLGASLSMTSVGKTEDDALIRPDITNQSTIVNDCQRLSTILTL